MNRLSQCLKRTFYTIPWRNTRYRFAEVLKAGDFVDDSNITKPGDESWQK
jgi:hypothetical protein